MNNFKPYFSSIVSGMQRGFVILSLTSCLLAACSQNEQWPATNVVHGPTVSVEAEPYNHEVAALLQADYSADSLAVYTVFVNSHPIRFLGFIPTILSTHYDNVHDIIITECASGTRNHNYLYIISNRNSTYILRVIAGPRFVTDHTLEDHLPTFDEILSVTGGAAMNARAIRTDVAKIYVEDGLLDSIKQKVSQLDSRLVPVQGIEFREKF